MKIIMEKYHGIEHDCLVWDPQKNNMELDSKRVKEIYKSNLGVGTVGIVNGPIYDGNKLYLRIFNSDGSEGKLCENNIRIFLKYIQDARYNNNKNLIVSTSEGDILVTFIDELGDVMKVQIGETQYINNATSRHQSIRNVTINSGFIMLTNQFAAKLELIH